MASTDADGADRSHRRTYDFFTGLMKWGTIVSFIVAMLVILIIRA